MATPNNDLLLKKYQEYLDKLAGVSDDSSCFEQDTLPLNPSIGIVGGGMAGLYSAILLQHYIPGVKVKIYEANNRVGGSVYTYRFSPEPHQYFETGAMRMPDVESYQPVFALIDYLNQQFPNKPIELVDFKNSCPEGNRVFVNNTKQRDGHIMSVKYADEHSDELGFSKEATKGGISAGKLFESAFNPLEDALRENFEAALNKYSSMSLHDYMSNELGWSLEKISYVESMCSQTNIYHQCSVTQMFFSGYHSSFSCKTVQGGMSQLPELCAEDVKRKHGKILLNAKVQSICQQEDGVRIGYSEQEGGDLVYERFDSIIITILPAFIRMIPERPHFGPVLEHLLRTTKFIPVGKLGLRFKSRFWENPSLNPPPSYGGQSTTDLPSCQIVYPSDGAGDQGKGVLHTYFKSSDAQQYSLLSKAEKVKMALRDLQLLYPEVNVYEEYAGGEPTPTNENYLKEAFSMDWAGVVFHYPGQFLSFFPSMVKPQGNIYFAGSHLSSSFVWIQSALESSRRAVQQLALKYGIGNVKYLY